MDSEVIKDNIVESKLMFKRLYEDHTRIYVLMLRKLYEEYKYDLEVNDNEECNYMISIQIFTKKKCDKPIVKLEVDDLFWCKLIANKEYTAKELKKLSIYSQLYTSKEYPDVINLTKANEIVLKPIDENMDYGSIYVEIKNMNTIR